MSSWGLLFYPDRGPGSPEKLFQGFHNLQLLTVVSPRGKQPQDVEYAVPPRVTALRQASSSAEPGARYLTMTGVEPSDLGCRQSVAQDSSLSLQTLGNSCTKL